jgi:hypothetical protein
MVTRRALASRVKKITQKQAKKYMTLFQINPKIISLRWWTFGMNVELEHGSKYGLLTNVTNDDLELTAQIVLAHLIEFPDYYQRLQEMEHNAEKYWKSYKKPSIFV